MSVLKPLYALAIGLLVVAFVGFGISAFYPEPEYPVYPEEIQGDPNAGLTAEERRKLQEYQQEEREYQQVSSRYNLVVASISIGTAVLLLVASLLWLNRLPVIGDGTTLGAVFTLFYGLIRAFMTESEQIRFVAVAIGLVILVVLVYLKFARPAGRGPSTEARA